jgi:hypothetical protein
MRALSVAGITFVALMTAPPLAEAQLGALISPGRLAKAHASLEGLTNCQSCHEPGRGVTAGKCLSCHRPVADRMAARTGVHGNVKECVSCHVEHAGVDGKLRPFDQKAFEHATMTRFPLDGKHALVAADCAACHKARSFLTLTTTCVSCHADVHKGSLGTNCTSCHSTRTAFTELSGQFDHSKAAFPLSGAHRTAACEWCHVNKTFKGIRFASCTNCHRDPHRPAPIVAAGTQRVVAQTPGVPATCTSCHTTATWRTRKVNHDTQTAFPLLGRHASVDCAACHTQPVMKVKPRSDTCAACHVDVHRGAFRQDCKACHNESGFQKALFDHSQTTFALTGSHQPLACSDCHKNLVPSVPPVPSRGGGRATTAGTAVSVDFRGLKTACVSCHVDVHQAELGATCESCHGTTSFRIPNYVHPRFADFFSGQHASLACEKCHVPGQPARPAGAAVAALNVKFRSAVTTCVSCHRDVHLGQEGSACENCHSIQTPKFGLVNFSHAKTRFTLTGRHEAIACATCHKVETGTFPSGVGTAARLAGVGRECRACHADVHLGQLSTSCESCHGTTSFRLASYTHRNQRSDFFVGRHATAGCAACHKPVAAQFPAGRGTAVRFRSETRCVACHLDVHRGSLGPDCINCHRP